MPDNTGPENLADVLARLFTSRGWGRKSERMRLETAWAEAAGLEFSPATRVGAFRRGVLEVEVRNAVLLQELAHFHKRRLLADLRTRLPGMTLADLKFRAGAW
jgi:hypothetical protein